MDIARIKARFLSHYPQYDYVWMKAMLEDERRKNATVKSELSQMRKMNAAAISSPRPSGASTGC